MALDQAARAGLMSKYHALPHHLALKWCRMNPDILHYKDDLAQEGWIGLLRAAEKFDPNRGVVFMTYAYPFVEEAIRRMSKKMSGLVGGNQSKWRSSKAIVYYQDDRTHAEGGKSPIADLPGTPFEPESLAELDAGLVRQAALEVCQQRQQPERDYDIFILGVELSLSEAGRRHGLTRERARQIYEKVLSAAREKLGVVVEEEE